MNNYYVSLIGPLLGCFLEVEANNEIEVRLAMNHSKLKNLWCSIYPLFATAVACTPADRVHNIRCSIESLVEDWYAYQQATKGISK